MMTFIESPNVPMFLFEMLPLPVVTFPRCLVAYSLYAVGSKRHPRKQTKNQPTGLGIIPEPFHPLKKEFS